MGAQLYVMGSFTKAVKAGVMTPQGYEETRLGTPQGGLCGSRHKEPYAERVIMPSKGAIYV